MGVSLNVAFDKFVPGCGTLTDDHPFLGTGLGRIDVTLRKAGLTPLDDFVSTDPSEDEDDAPAAVLPTVQRFPAAEGLSAARAAIAHLEAKPTSLTGSAAALDELAAVEVVLVAAVKWKARFHFLVCD